MADGIDLIGGGDVLIRLANLGRITDRAIERAHWHSGRDLKKAASDEILRKPKSGRLYISRNRSGRRRRHVASAPGETHANFSGTLRQSLDFKVRGSKQLEFGYGITKGNAPVYAPFVEFGTQRMASRPSLRNAIRASRRNIIGNLNRELRTIGK